MKRSWILGVLLSLLPALGAAQADRFQAIDRNGDGFVSSEEWYRQQVVPVPFTVVDLNGDGRISENEYREWSSARGGASVRGVTSADRFRAIDKNKDGVISQEEWKTGWLSPTPFESVDADRDGKISRREFSAWDQRRVPAVAAPTPPPGTGPASVSRPPAAAVQAPRPPAASSLTPAPASPVTATPSTSPGASPGASSPNMRSGSSLLNK